ncbi:MULTISPECIES: shikimate kinase AroK [unclassified Acinetobacter]|uniref:shikimate kinase AroK n=1 Tax=unclassified Acinetobacter TaxID=196816 RepID=UPI00244A7AB5|nr:MULTISPECIES: shikimate kinase AroK [unclassified Acinetobacter]MDH0029856.1 shikimate kinase AroK [Acinetobacter sp. GD04021]MDH0885380.1 shikimate kinase AroK [Acinetobacter sp. GD03873]MDH1081498.1 shikimate kinase AroK [Acinetobacter sp. GD03983]MDH2188721.1 shikimate kinase AroK [Acinetobacter sp. GD03645]MDH2203444.1 shikimate kinase AroK [Acinetobacter sp. GD03647]
MNIGGALPSKAFETLPNIYLVGPMGAGKTTVGRHLAELLGRDFLDSDHEIERKTGATIPWIFEKEGEAGFRLRETNVINELTARSALVLATGGGAVTQSANREFLNQRGIVVYLYTPVELQLQRTYRDKNRPLLQVENPEQKLRDLLTARDPLYREVAHHIIETNQGAARDLAQRILQIILSQSVQ